MLKTFVFQNEGHCMYIYIFCFTWYLKWYFESKTISFFSSAENYLLPKVIIRVVLLKRTCCMVAIERSSDFLFKSFFCLGYVIISSFSCRLKRLFFEISEYSAVHLKTDHFKFGISLKTFSNCHI